METKNLNQFKNETNNNIVIQTPMEIVNINADRKDLLAQSKFLQDYTKLSKEILNSKNKISSIINRLPCNINVDIKQNFLKIVKKESIENTISVVYENLSSNLREYGDALCKINNNQCKILELINILAECEEDLYKLHDCSEISTNEFRQLIREWCKNENISDENVLKLLDSSFSRSKTLSDKINNLREDVGKRVERIEIDLNSIKDDLNQSVKNAQDKLESILSNHKTSIEETIKEQKNVLQQTLDTVRNNIEQVVKAIDDKREGLQSEIRQAVKTIEQARMELQNERDATASFYTEQLKEIEKQVDSAVKRSQQLIDEQETKHEKELLNVKEMFENILREQEGIFNGLRDEQRKEFEAVKQTIFSTFLKRTVLYCSITGVISVVVAVLLCSVF